MYLRKHARIKDGKSHLYWSLMETVRTDDGPRQRLLCYLGELNSCRMKSWRKVIKVFNEEGEEEQLELFPSETPAEDPTGRNIVRVDLSSIRLERAREFGAVYLAYEIWKRLKLDIFWQQTIDHFPSGTQADTNWYPASADGRTADIPWSKVAAILATNRLCDPGSELSIEEKWYKSTALADLLGIPEDKINTDRLYRCLDHLIVHKEDLEKHLKARYGELFEIKYNIILYDLTSTYFEGAANGNPQAKRGYSRDHRPDCKQICIALVVSEEGFPLAYEVFDGNREGAYLLRTNIKEKDPKLLWEKYMQLTEAEAAFRALKSELSIRPIFHQKEERVQAHIMVAFLGYALWVTIKHTLKRTLPDFSPARALSILQRIHSGDILLDTVEADNHTKRTIRLRRIFSPDDDQKMILAALKISLPERLSFDLISKCSADLLSKG